MNAIATPFGVMCNYALKDKYLNNSFALSVARYMGTEYPYIYEQPEVTKGLNRLEIGAVPPKTNPISKMMTLLNKG